jgi:hypothetical protein
LHEDKIKRIKNGLILSCVGDPGGRRTSAAAGDAIVDRAVEKILRDEEANPNIVDFWLYGYDERQYNSFAFRLNVACAALALASSNIIRQRQHGIPGSQKPREVVQAHAANHRRARRTSTKR